MQSCIAKDFDPSKTPRENVADSIQKSQHIAGQKDHMLRVELLIGMIVARGKNHMFLRAVSRRLWLLA